MKPSVGQFVILLPVALAVVSFILSMLALFAGREPGFMEDYAVVRLNTSMVGHTFFGKGNKDDKDGEKKGGGGLLGGLTPRISIPGISSIPGGNVLGDVKDWVDDKTSGVKDKLNDITGSIADKIVKKIGIKEWYSLHIMDSCEGYFQPNSSSPNVELNVTKCTSSNPSHRLNLTELLDKELGIGPAKLNLADIKWPQGIQDTLDVLNNALLGLLIMYALGAGLSFVSAVGGVAAFLKPDMRIFALVNFVIGGLGFLSIFIGSIIVTVATSTGVGAVNKIGNPIGLSASRGTKFYALSWVSTGFMGFVMLFWMVRFCMIRRQRLFIREKPWS
ncbi:Actin cortical patch SUR7/pH-response regulator PalI [Metarhizium album ARSEF 1941]|uniref:Actin cortical patch SUR7/pH-response regulator PalI n=1 Tax=Metarhizium album (strain ARSEF 1941) TaxID=1081103 RepID=A0A0B2WQR6_METAS|nr:Actin cortical patch SUR7/pH-response regulator PalI [Metarhizium album ARSEF 1941]KHN95832.1 Actin cortical patch SUR7/pH-response regulator PalI [Metarhizium album ARSEF 1941]